LLEKGGNVIISSLHWTAYGLTAKSLSADAKLIKTRLESNWEVNVEDLKRLFDTKTKLRILNNPNNPTSKVVNQKVMGGMVDVASERGIRILSDEVYADLSFVKTKSLLEYEGEHIVVNSFSKTFAMSGWRIGYIIADKALTDKIIKPNQITFTNVPVFIQEAALKALELRDHIIKTMRKKYRKRTDPACKILSDTKLKFTKFDGLNSKVFTFNLLDKVELGLKTIAEAFK
jgi:aspartate aminotransferase